MTDVDIKMVRAERDAANPNNRRISVNGSQWCKVYGFSPEQAKARADQISRALMFTKDPEPEHQRRDARAMAELSRQNMADAWAGFSAMRDAINEVIPLPSPESDLQHGPEMSVSCAVVAEAVVAAIQAERAANTKGREVVTAILKMLYSEGDYRGGRSNWEKATDLAVAAGVMDRPAPPAEQAVPPPPPWPGGGPNNANAKREGWLAFFTGRDRESCPFPKARDDLQRDFRAGWDAAKAHQA